MADAEAGTSTALRSWTALRVAQAIAALAPTTTPAGGGGVTISATAPTGASNGDFWWDTSGTLDAGLKVRVSSSWVSVADPRIVQWARAGNPSGFVPINRGGTNSGTAGRRARPAWPRDSRNTRRWHSAAADVIVLGTGGLIAAPRMGSGTANISRDSCAATEHGWTRVQRHGHTGMKPRRARVTAIRSFTPNARKASDRGSSRRRHFSDRR